MAKNTSMGIKISGVVETGTGQSYTGAASSTSAPPSTTSTPKEVAPTTEPKTTAQETNTKPLPETKAPAKSTVYSLKNPNIKGLPFKKGDQPIQPNDSGEAVKWVQDFLQSLPETKKQQEFLASSNFSSGGQVDKLDSSKHYGIYDLETRRYLRDYQNKNKARIKKLGQLTDSELESEINSAVITFATVNAILEDKGEVNVIQEGKKEVDPVPEKVENVVPDPPAAASVPESTFFVKTKNPNHRLALRKAPAYSKVSKEAEEDEDKKGERVDMMSNETLLKVIVPHIGFNCEWHQVEVVDPDPKWDKVRELQKTQKLYSFAEFIHPRKSTKSLIPVNCENCTEMISGSDRKTPFPNWVDMTECDVFYDVETAQYYITVESNHEGIAKIELPAVKKQAMYEGISNLLDFYDRENGKDQIQRIIDVIGDTSLEQEDYFLEERPESRLKFLVGLPKKYFDSVPRRKEFFDGVPTHGGILPKEWRTVVFNYGDLKPGLELIAKRLEEYALEIENWDGQVLNFDAKDEAQKLLTFIPIFEKFLKWNEVKIEEDNSNRFEIGFGGPCFKLLYVLEKKENVMVPLRIGIECFKNLEPVIFERTMGYVFYHPDMVKDIKKEKRRWISFVNSYTCPIARIIPSGNRVQGKVEKKLNDSPVKTTTEKIKEDKKIEEAKPNLIAERGDVDYVGDPLFSCEGGSTVMDRVKDLNDLYKTVLNRTNINDMSSLVSSCIASGMSPSELNSAACDYVLKSLGYEQLMSIIQSMNENEYSRVQSKLDSSITDPQFLNADPSLRVRMAITEGADKSSLCQLISQFDPSLIASFLKKLIPSSFSFPQRPKVPTLNLRDSLPTEDTLRDIRSTLENAIKEAISQSLFMLVRILFQSLCKLCSGRDTPPPVENFGDNNINDVFKRRGIDPKKFNFDNFDIPPDINMGDFFDDLSNILTLSELCSLLLGTASSETIRVVKSLMRRKYPDLLVYLNDTYKIKKIFKHIGKFIDPSLCKEAEERFGSIPENLCEEKENLKRDLLNGRLSDELIEEQIRKEKERTKELLRQMVKLTEDGVLDSFLPPVVNDPCNKKGVNTAIATSIIPNDPPSVQKLNDQVVDVMFNGIEGSFNVDMKGFVDGLIEVERETVDSAEYAKLYDLERVMSKDINDNNWQDRLKNPANGKVKLSVVPFLKNNLFNINNFSVVKNSFTDFNYKFPIVSADFTAIFNKLLEEKKKIESGRSVVVENSIAPKAIVSNGLSLAVPIGGNFAIQTACIEDTGILPGIAPISGLELVKEKMGSDDIIRYFFQKYSGNSDNILDKYRFKVNDIGSGNEYIFSGEVQLESDIKNFISNHKVTSGESINQSVFAEHVQGIWLANLTDESRKKVLEKGEFRKYLKDNLFAEIVEKLMQKLAMQTANSDLFFLEDLERVEFVPDQEIVAEGCEAKEIKSMLDVDSTKEKTSDRYEKETNKCKDRLDPVLSKMGPMERAGLYSAIETYVKLFVIESVLKGLFVFSTFKVKDLFGDRIVVDYILKKVEEEIKKQSEGFYSLVLKGCKDVLESRGGGLLDPFSPSLDSSVDDKKIIDNSDPRWVSGEKALEFLIKENLKGVSDLFDDMLGFEKSEDLYRFFLDEWYSPNNRDLNEDPKFLKGYVANGKGDFLVEKYVRSCGENEWQNVVRPTSINFVKGRKFVYGFRISYVLSPNVNFRKNVFDLEVDERINKRENSFIYKVDVKVGEDKKTTGPDPVIVDKIETQKYCVFPLMSVEEEVYRTDKLDGPALEMVINSLKDKMVASEEFRTMFSFVFPLQRFLSLNCIYNMVAISSAVKNIDFKFSPTKKMIRNLIGILVPSDDPWWKKKVAGIDDRGGNEKIRQEYMQNITTNGPSVDHASIAAMTVSILIKGLAEKHDPCYILMKQIFDVAPDALIGGLGW
ncbi:MAG: hypothetical protein Q8P81_01480, partial [Nanoarchaeota archaeon]|nr:hypothetical protein [Nanoarchaeota archaeon]